MQRFVKGRTNNHLTWVMVDATDFATPESNCSAATTIKIYGKVRGGTGTNLVSSGTGSLTNDITHVGASATGIYTIALAKADLSDASAAWYDQYVIHLSATGSARQTLVVDGGIDESTMLVLSDAVSNVYSAVAATLDIASDAHSAATQANSKLVVNKSDISDIQSQITAFSSDMLSRVPSVVPTVSGLSALISDVQSQITAVQSDFQSRVPKAVATASMLSDFYSDFQSRVPKATATASMLSDVYSDFQSRVPKAVATASALTAFSSDMLSRVPSLVPTVSGLSALISDVISAVVAAPALTRDAVFAKTFSEPTAVPSFSDDFAEIIANWNLIALGGHQVDATSHVQRNMADDTDRWKHTHSDGGTEYDTNPAATP